MEGKDQVSRDLLFPKPQRTRTRGTHGNEAATGLKGT